MLRLMVDLLRIANSKSEAPIEFVCPITFQVRELAGGLD